MSRSALQGRTVVVTRARSQAAELADLLEARGATVLEFPTIRIDPVEDWGPVDRAVRDMASYDWIVFTSANAVRAFFGRLDALAHQVRHQGVHRPVVLDGGDDGLTRGVAPPLV